jgi:hypothetical protein
MESATSTHISSRMREPLTNSTEILRRRALRTPQPIEGSCPGSPLRSPPPLPSRIGPVGFAEFGRGYARDLAGDPAAAAWAEFDAMVFDRAVTSASKTQARRVFYAVAGQIG